MKRSLLAAGAGLVAALTSTAVAAPEEVTILVRPAVVGGDQATTLFGSVDARRATRS